jgi:hypothetical protein
MMGASRLKPPTVKEIQKLTLSPPPTIKHRSLGVVPGFVLVHIPAGYTGYILGDYAQTATDSGFLEVRYHPHQEKVARMRGKRLVFIHEVEGYPNRGRVKSIASGKAVSASFKGKDSFEFRPEA